MLKHTVSDYCFCIINATDETELLYCSATYFYVLPAIALFIATSIHTHRYSYHVAIPLCINHGFFRGEEGIE